MERPMPILFRSKGWLTIAQLAKAWATELPGAEGHASRCEQDLLHLMAEDIVNGLFDNAGPLRDDGQRLGLRLIMPDHRPRFLEGHEVSELIGLGEEDRYLFDWIVVMKEAVFDFAHRRQLPPPSWWADGAASVVPEYRAAPTVTAPASSPASHGPAAPVLPPKRGRKSWKRGPVEAAMRNDIQEGRLTLAELQTMGEKVLADRYKASRDTVRKAREVVLSELSNDKNDKRQFPTH
jgi:hypothetical protein